MPEDFANLHVLGVTTEQNPPGNVLHTMRTPTGWTSFTPVPLPPHGKAVDVACVRRVPVAPETVPLTQGLWALIAYENGPSTLHFRNSNTSQWEGPIPNIPLATATRVAITVSPGVAPANDTNPGAPRAYVHMVAVVNGVTPQDQGRLIASVIPNRGTGGAAVMTAQVQTSGAGDLGSVQAVALAPAIVSPFSPPGPESVASLAAVFSDDALFFTQGGVYATVPAGQWAPFRARDLAPPNGPGARPYSVRDVALARGQASAAITDSNEYMGVVRGGGDSDIYGATLSSGGWSAWENYEIFRTPPISVDIDPGAFTCLDMSKTTEGLHVVGAVAGGQIFHELRVPAAPGSVIFRDVELVGVGQEVGAFTAVACG
jgi:hypothetical protein